MVCRLYHEIRCIFLKSYNFRSCSFSNLINGMKNGREHLILSKKVFKEMLISISIDIGKNGEVMSHFRNQLISK